MKRPKVINKHMLISSPIKHENYSASLHTQTLINKILDKDISYSAMEDDSYNFVSELIPYKHTKPLVRVSPQYRFNGRALLYNYLWHFITEIDNSVITASITKLYSDGEYIAKLIKIPYFDYKKEVFTTYYLLYIVSNAITNMTYKHLNSFISRIDEKPFDYLAQLTKKELTSLLNRNT